MRGVGVKVREVSKSQIILGLRGYGKEFGFYFPRMATPLEDFEQSNYMGFAFLKYDFCCHVAALWG